MKNLMFMIEGGKPLELVQQHIAEVRRVREANRALLQELGLVRGTSDRLNGRLSGVVFENGVRLHPQFKKPNRDGVSYPKKGTEWAQRFAAQQGYPSPVTAISEAFGVPCSLSFKTSDGQGWTCIGNMLSECGFLYFGMEGPWAMWTPDVPAEVAALEASGKEVMEPAKSWRPVIEGARLIEPEEWEILVAQHKLAEKRAAAQQPAAEAAHG